MNDHLYWRGGVQVPPIDELVESLRRKFKDQEEELARIKKENEHLKSEHYKDEEISRLKKKVETLHKRLIRSFEVTEDEWDEIHKWLADKDSRGASYIFEPTGLGDFCKVRCQGEEFIFRELE